MHGAEYDEMCDAIDKVRDKFESVEIAEPMPVSYTHLDFETGENFPP